VSDLRSGDLGGNLRGDGRRGVAILGSTGSIGRSTLAVIGMHPERFRVSVLGAHSSWQAVVEQAQRFEPDAVVLVDPCLLYTSRCV